MTNNATVLISENILQATADAIRNKGGTSGSIKPTDFAETIKAIATGGLDTSDATATAAEIFQGKIAYAQGRKLTGTFTIDEELNTQDDLIAQIVTALEGKAAGGEIEVEYSENEDAIINRTITSYTNNRITTIGDFAFHELLVHVGIGICCTVCRDQQIGIFKIWSLNGSQSDLNRPVAQLIWNGTCSAVAFCNSIRLQLFRCSTCTSTAGH